MPSPCDVALEMGRAEKAGDRQALERCLHEDLIFRRADGSIVDRKSFLDTVKERDHLDSEVLEDEEEEKPNSDSVVVTLIVRTRGASFRNVRVFVRDGGTWRCKLWINTKLDTWPPLKVEMLHHVSLPVTDLTISRGFYEGVLGLRESKIPRPEGESGFDFEGAWYQVGAGQLHLIVPKADLPAPTFRERKDPEKEPDSRDVHFALRVHSFEEALEHLESKKYSENAKYPFKLKVSRHRRGQRAGFPQIYILDPDCHVIEINAERMAGEPDRRPAHCSADGW